MSVGCRWGAGPSRRGGGSLPREGTLVAGARCQALSPQLMQQQAALVAAHSAYLSPMATMAVQMQHMGTVNPNGLIATPLPPSSGRWHLARGGHRDAGDGDTGRGGTREWRTPGMGTWDIGDTRDGDMGYWGHPDMGDIRDVQGWGTWRGGAGRRGTRGWGRDSGIWGWGHQDGGNGNGDVGTS